eukprot:Gb_18537 [translate_table: standard]
MPHITFVLGTDTALTTPGTIVHFYKINGSCPTVEIYVRKVVQDWYFKDPSITAALLRLQYTDCFIGGCDASILLDSYKGRQSEKMAPQNAGLSGFTLIDNIKTVLEDKCPGIVSCADIIALATRDAVALSGGPAYPVPTGRRDGFISSKKKVNLPAPNITARNAVALFKSKGLEASDLVTLLGAHNYGSAHCRYFSDRLYNFKGTGKADPKMDQSFLNSLKKSCPLGGPAVDVLPDPEVFMNPVSGKEYVFDNSYYNQTLKRRALLQIDQDLAYNKGTKDIVKDNAADINMYKFSFADSMAKMGDIGVLTGKKGEIRQNCRLINKNNPK